MQPQHAARKALSLPQQELRLSLQDHGIEFFLPPNSRLEVVELKLQGGALIYGEFHGKLVCETGSLMLPRGSKFFGEAEADNLYVEGEVGSYRTASGAPKISKLTGRVMVAVSANASVYADIKSRAFAIHSKRIWGQIEVIE